MRLDRGRALRRHRIVTLKTLTLPRGLRNREYTIVIVTHNMQQASRVSDKTAFFYVGELIEFGETAQLFNRPKQAKSEGYITGRFG